jgi:hypothetical protein
MLREDAALQGVPLFPGHGADVERICGLFVRPDYWAFHLSAD